MARFFFHLDGKSRVEDRVGQELATLHDAAVSAQQVAREILRSADPKTLEGYSIVVADEAGQRLLEFPLNEAGSMEIGSQVDARRKSQGPGSHH
jgi:hypothetical protein